jgi:5'-methylthioadenosine phosphorylase
MARDTITIMTSSSVHIGIIGGSGLYDMAEVTDREERTVATPFGDPSGPYVIGTLRGKRVAFLSRHGVGHRLLPSELNFRANIYGFKVLGVERIVSASAVGSLKPEYRPLDILVPDQFFDRTKGRISTFFGRGLVAHVAFAHPICRHLSASGDWRRPPVRPSMRRTYVNMEGRTRRSRNRSCIESGMDVIGDNLQEAKLVREAEMCCTLAPSPITIAGTPTDLVTVDLIVANLLQNAARREAIAEAVG